MRLFVGVWLPEEARRALRDLPRPARPGLRWVPEDRWHVTLRFLGDLEAPDPVVAAVRRAARGHGPARASLGGRTRRIGGVLAAPVDGLDDLARQVVGATAHLGRPPDPRPFAGHVTLARGRGRGRGRTRVPGGVAGVAVADVAWDVGELAVVRSETGPHPGYSTVAAVPLVGVGG